MKKISGLLLALVLAVGCGKENILWLEPGHEYEITNILVRNPSGNWEDARPIVFPQAERITFKKLHPLGAVGDGIVTVIDENYQTTDYIAYGAWYNQWCGCYYYDWYTYTIIVNQRKANEYRFTWDKESQKNISFQFSRYDPIMQGSNPNQISFWEFLNGEYVVSRESRKEGKLVADVIVLKSQNVELVLKR